MTYGNCSRAENSSGFVWKNMLILSVLLSAAVSFSYAQAVQDLTTATSQIIGNSECSEQNPQAPWVATTDDIESSGVLQTPSTNTHSDTQLIIGLSVGFACFFIFLIHVVCCCCVRKKRNDALATKSTPLPGGHVHIDLQPVGSDNPALEYSVMSGCSSLSSPSGNDEMQDSKNPLELKDEVFNKEIVPGGEMHDHVMEETKL